MSVLNEVISRRILEKLRFLYGDERARALMPRVEQLIGEFEVRPATVAASERVAESDVMLITYGDLLRRDGESPLATLYEALDTYLKGVISSVHILPFFPYSSDDGFSVIDYLEVDPALGGWDDVRRLGRDFKLMFDAVLNHMSVQSAWFKGFLADDPAYRDFFITVDPTVDLSAVTRPRALPLLTPFETATGVKHVWTTFSDDQVDLNFASEDVLLAFLRVLLTYVANGASFIRLDAIAYLWKEIGTSCIHLPQTHTVVKLMRDVLDAVAPDVMIISETNVPHDENISYFGDGTDEAQMVYQFSLPPLVVHSFGVGSAEALSRWAASLDKASDETTYFNFTASHDGIGVRPATGLISDAEVDALTVLARERGGRVSYKTNSDGTQSPYELNVTYVDAIVDPAQDDDVAAQAQRFLASQAIMLAFVGVPGIYFHSLLGSRNWTEGVAETSRARTVNREKLDFDTLKQELADPTSFRHHVFNGYRDLLRIRTSERAFHPNGPQKVLNLNDGVFALLRTSPDAAERIIALHNVTGQSQTVSVTAEHILGGSARALKDLKTGTEYGWQDGLTLKLGPYQIMWLKVLG